MPNKYGLICIVLPKATPYSNFSNIIPSRKFSTFTLHVAVFSTPFAFTLTVITSLPTAFAVTKPFWSTDTTVSPLFVS